MKGAVPIEFKVCLYVEGRGAKKLTNFLSIFGKKAGTVPSSGLAVQFFLISLKFLYEFPLYELS